MYAALVAFVNAAEVIKSTDLERLMRAVLEWAMARHLLKG